MQETPESCGEWNDLWALQKDGSTQPHQDLSCLMITWVSVGGLSEDIRVQQVLDGVAQDLQSSSLFIRWLTANNTAMPNNFRGHGYPFE